MRFFRLIAAALLFATLAGCAANPRTLQWIQENESEKRRLNDQGFPQYNYTRAEEPAVPAGV